MMIFFKRWYIKEIINNSTPNNIKAAIFPPAGIFLISFRNNFASVAIINVREIIRRVLLLKRMPSHIITNAQIP